MCSLPTRANAMQERRHSPRTRMLRAGKIVFNSKSSVIDCMVRNCSQAGACLAVSNVIGVPFTFELRVAGQGASRPCRMIWNSQNRIGIEFRG